jgi:hypothetical protein
MGVKRPGGLDLEQNLVFQYREWRFQRLGWALISVLLAAAIGGLFGGGLLSQARVSAPDGSLQVAYERFARADAPTIMTITMLPAISERQVRVEFDRAYLQSIVIEYMVPLSQQVHAGPDRIVHVFDVGQPAQAMTATLHMRPLVAGLVEGKIALGHRAVTLRQLIYP